MLFALTYISLLLIPGFLITRLLNIKAQALLFSVAFSLSCLAVILLTCISLNLSDDAFYMMLLTLLGLLLVLNLFSKQSFPTINQHKLLGLIIVMSVSGFYLNLVGFYDELPSDIYIHLERFGQVQDQLQTGFFKQATGLELLDKSTKYWYHILILITNFLQINFIDSIAVFSVINVMLLLACLYEFNYWLFDTIKNNTQLIFTAMLSTLFFSLHFGINVFAFIRYYSIAPTILNYCIYLSFIISLVHYYRSTFEFKKFLPITVLLFCSAYLLHAQEALFIGTIFVLISAILFIQKLSSANSNRLSPSIPSIRTSVYYIFPATVLVIAAVYFYAINSLTPATIESSKIISLRDLFGLSNQWLVLNPFTQFYRVLTHWGLFTFLLYIFYYRRFFSNQPVLLACMLVPFATIFNPIFVDLFLRIAYGDVLWRFLFMLPLYSIAARIVAGLLFEKEHRVLIKGWNLTVIALIFILLLPIKFSNIDLPYSRLFTLFPVHDQARPVHWQDMLDYLHELPKKEIIITDPVSGYMISALTKHHNRRFKFHRHTMLDKYEFEDYNRHPLSQYSGKLLVINQRTGLSTKTAKIARHWNPKNLNLSEFYNENLLKHIQSQTEHFELLWQADDISIYRINY